MPVIDPAVVAHGLMLDKARNVTEREVCNELGDHAGVGELTGGEYEALVARVLDEIRAADIQIGSA